MPLCCLAISVNSLIVLFRDDRMSVSNRHSKDLKLFKDLSNELIQGKKLHVSRGICISTGVDSLPRLPGVNANC